MTLTFDGTMVRTLAGAGVYIFWKDEQALYVGDSARVGERAFCVGLLHDRKRARLQCTHVEIRLCGT